MDYKQITDNLRAIVRDDWCDQIAAADDLLAALENYQRLVDYLQRTTNPEEWATHGDWRRLQAEAAAAIAKARS